MKKILLLTKTLLAAVLLCVGQNAWAGDVTVVKYSFDDASSPSFTPGSRTSFDYSRTSVITSTKFLNAYNDANGDPGAATISLGSTDLSEKTWTLEFEWAACGGCNSKADHTTLKAGDTTLFDISGNSNWNTTVTLSYGASGSATLPVPGCDKGKRFSANVGDQYNTTDYWHHFVITGSAEDGVKLTVTNSSSGTKVVDDVTLSSTNVSPTSIIIEPCCGGAIALDELHLYYVSNVEAVSVPSFGVAYAGANRTVTITPGVSSESNPVTTYYTLDGSDPTNESNEYTTSLTITENCTVKAISISSTSVSSEVSSQAVTVGKIPLATPTISASGFTNTTGASVNNPTFSFACDNSKIEGTPTATLYYTFTPYGGVESSETAGSSFTPTAYGTLKVIAKNDDYSSSEKTLVVSSLYTISYTGRDYTTATTSDISTAEGFWGAEFDVTWDGWASGLKANLKNPVMSDDYRLRINNTGTVNLVSGWGWVRNDNGYGYQSRYAKEGYFVGLKTNTSKGNNASALTYPTAYCSFGSGVAMDVVTINVPAGNLVQQLYFYEASPTTVSVTVSDAGMATYVPSYDLDFSASEIKAYKAKVTAKGVCTLTEVANVPAGTPVVLVKDGGATENIPVMTGATAVSENDLVAGTGETVETEDGDYTNMILNNVDGKVGFYFANGQTVATNRAYLHFDSSLAPAEEGESTARSMRIVFDGVTSVDNVEAAVEAKAQDGKFIENGKIVIVKNGVKYNAAGQQVK